MKERGTCVVLELFPQKKAIFQRKIHSFVFVKVGGQYESHIFAKEKTDVSMVCISGSACRYVVSR